MPSSINYLVVKGCGTLDKEKEFKFFDKAKDALRYRDDNCNRWDNIYKKVDLIVTEME